MGDAAVDVARVVLVYTSVLGAMFAAAVCAWLRWGATGAQHAPRVGLDGVPRLVAPELFRSHATPSDGGGQRGGSAERSASHASRR